MGVGLEVGRGNAWSRGGLAVCARESLVRRRVGSWNLMTGELG